MKRGKKGRHNFEPDPRSITPMPSSTVPEAGLSYETGRDSGHSSLCR